MRRSIRAMRDCKPLRIEITAGDRWVQPINVRVGETVRPSRSLPLSNCDGERTLTVGARAASLASVSAGQLFGSSYNDDRS